MSQKYQYYFLQPVTEEELNEGFAGLENADRAMMTDQGLVGIFSGGAVAQHSPMANLTIDVGCPVIGYDDFGQRIFVPGSLANVNIAQDSSSVSTAVAGSSNEKWVSIALQFTRVLTDPREDGNSQTVYFNEAESFLWIITQGAEAAVGTAPRPSIDPDNLLLCDVNLRFGTTQVLNAAIDTTRRQDTFLIAGTPVSIRAGTNYGAVQAMLDALNTHILSTGNAHPASAIGVSGLSAWADGTLNSGFTDLYDFLETGLITALAGTSGGGGTAKIAGPALYNFLDGQNIGAGPLLGQLNGFVVALSASTASHDGARRVYYNPAGSTTPLTATTVGSALDQLDSNSHSILVSLTATAAALAGIGGTSINWTAAESFAAPTSITAPVPSGSAAFTVLNNIDIGATMSTATAFCALFHGQIIVFGGAVFSSVLLDGAVSRGATAISPTVSTYPLAHTPNTPSLYICNQVGSAATGLTITLQNYSDTTPSAICPNPEIEVVFRGLQGTPFVIQTATFVPVYTATWGSLSADGALSVRLRWEVISGTGRWVQLSSSINLAYS